MDLERDENEESSHFEKTIVGQVRTYSRKPKSLPNVLNDQPQLHHNTSQLASTSGSDMFTLSSDDRFEMDDMFLPPILTPSLSVDGPDINPDTEENSLDEPDLLSGLSENTSTPDTISKPCKYVAYVKRTTSGCPEISIQVESVECQDEIPATSENGLSDGAGSINNSFSDHVESSDLLFDQNWEARKHITVCGVRNTTETGVLDGHLQCEQDWRPDAAKIEVDGFGRRVASILENTTELGNSDFVQPCSNGSDTSFRDNERTQEDTKSDHRLLDAQDCNISKSTSFASGENSDKITVTSNGDANKLGDDKVNSCNVKVDSKQKEKIEVESQKTVGLSRLIGRNRRYYNLLGSKLSKEPQRPKDSDEGNMVQSGVQNVKGAEETILENGVSIPVSDKLQSSGNEEHVSQNGNEPQKEFQTRNDSSEKRELTANTSSVENESEFAETSNNDYEKEKNVAETSNNDYEKEKNVAEHVTTKQWIDRSQDSGFEPEQQTVWGTSSQLEAEGEKNNESVSYSLCGSYIPDNDGYAEEETPSYVNMQNAYSDSTYTELRPLEEAISGSDKTFVNLNSVELWEDVKNMSEVKVISTSCEDVDSLRKKNTAPSINKQRSHTDFKWKKKMIKEMRSNSSVDMNSCPKPASFVPSNVKRDIEQDATTSPKRPRKRRKFEDFVDPFDEDVGSDSSKSVSATEVCEAEPPAKKPRGRPPKNRHSQEVKVDKSEMKKANDADATKEKASNDDVSKTQSSALDDITVTTPVKRGRGRPRKIVSLESNQKIEASTSDSAELEPEQKIDSGITAAQAESSVLTEIEDRTEVNDSIEMTPQSKDSLSTNESSVGDTEMRSKRGRLLRYHSAIGNYANMSKYDGLLEEWERSYKKKSAVKSVSTYSEEQFGVHKVKKKRGRPPHFKKRGRPRLNFRTAESKLDMVGGKDAYDEHKRNLSEENKNYRNDLSKKGYFSQNAKVRISATNGFLHKKQLVKRPQMAATNISGHVKPDVHVSSKITLSHGVDILYKERENIARLLQLLKPPEVVYGNTNDFQSSDVVACGRCRNVQYLGVYKKYHALQHYYLCWVQGDPPLNMGDADALLEILHSVLLSDADHNEAFVCEYCDASSSSPKEFVTHVIDCPEQNNRPRIRNISKKDLSAAIKLEPSEEEEEEDVSSIATEQLPSAPITLDDEELTNIVERPKFVKSPDTVFGDTNDFHSSEMVRCGRCKKVMKLGYYRQYHAPQHYYLCWIDGEQPLNMKNGKALFCYLRPMVLHQYQVRREVLFICELCKSTWKSTNGYAYHVASCRHNSKSPPARKKTWSKTSNLTPDQQSTTRISTDEPQSRETSELMDGTEESSTFNTALQSDDLDHRDTSMIDSNELSTFIEDGELTEEEIRNMKDLLKFLKPPKVYFQNCEDFNSSDMIQCGRCEEQMKLSYYRKYHSMQHYYLSWLKDEPPLDMENPEELNLVLRSAISAQAQRNRMVLFYCEMCGTTTKTPIGYANHIVTCSKETECSICKKWVSLRNVKCHELSHRFSRSNEDGSNLKSQEENKKFKRGKSTHDGGKQKLRCYSCHFWTLDRRGMVLHARKCSVPVNGVLRIAAKVDDEPTSDDDDNDDNNRDRKLCSELDDDDESDKTFVASTTPTDTDISTDEDSSAEEETDDEDDNDLSLNRKKRKRKRKEASHVPYRKICWSDPLEETSKWRGKYYSQKPLFPHLKVDLAKWKIFLDKNDASKYIPSASESIYFSSSRNLVQKLRKFESDIIEECPTFFAGGPVWAMAWVTFPGNITSDQYLGVACHPQMNQAFNINEIYQFTSVIQIWRFPNLDNEKSSPGKPKLLFGIAHNDGAIWSMEWAPSGGYDESSESGRLGVLAVATSAGHVSIYSVPHPNSLRFSTGNTIIQVDPDLILKRSANDDSEAQCTRVTWDKNAPHRTIYAGFSNGRVAMWHTDTISPLLRKENVIFPYKIFMPHYLAVTALSVHSMGEGRYLMTSSLDRWTYYWDLNDLSEPIGSYEKFGPLLDGTWMPHCPSGIASNDLIGLVCNIKPICNSSARAFIETGCKYLSCTRESYWSLSVSDWTNFVAASSNTGTVLVANYEHTYSAEDPKIIKDSKIVTRASLVPLSTLPIINEDENLRGNSVEEESNEDSYEFVISKYAVKFSSPQIKKKTASGQLSMHFPVASSNKVCWNPNSKSYRWLAVGYQCGIVRVIRVSTLKSNIGR